MVEVDSQERRFSDGVGLLLKEGKKTTQSWGRGSQGRFPFPKAGRTAWTRSCRLEERNRAVGHPLNLEPGRQSPHWIFIDMAVCSSLVLRASGEGYTRQARRE